MEGDTLPELSVAGHGVVLMLLSLLKQTFQKIKGTSSGARIAVLFAQLNITIHEYKF